MNTTRRVVGFLAGACAASMVAWVLIAAEQPASQSIQQPAQSQTSSSESNASPVAIFRKILSMSPDERGVFLTNNYPAEVRERVMAKVEEYQLLPEPFKELRLRTTEFGWYLRPLLTNSPAKRVDQLKLVPEPYRELIAARLEEWDHWPPTLKEEIIEYESTMDHFVGRGAVVRPHTSDQALAPSERSEFAQKLARWQSMPNGQREQMYASFEHYFRLSEDEKQKMLDALSEPERDQTERALNPVEKWPKPEQDKYFAALKQYLYMDPEQREQFRRNAERWQKMSEPERQAWRDLVKQLSATPTPPIGFVSPKSGGQPALQTNPTAAPQR
jgi:hypothetical protein